MQHNFKLGDIISDKNIHTNEELLYTKISIYKCYIHINYKIQMINIIFIMNIINNNINAFCFVYQKMIEFTRRNV